MSKNICSPFAVYDHLLKGRGSLYQAWSLAPREQYEKKGFSDLLSMADARIIPVLESRYRISDPSQLPSIDDLLRPCIPSTGGSSTPAGAAMLLGLSAALFGWDVDVFVSSRVFDSSEQERDATNALITEYGSDGINDIFRTSLEGTLCVIGSGKHLNELCFAYAYFADTHTKMIRFWQRARRLARLISNWDLERFRSAPLLVY